VYRLETEETKLNALQRIAHQLVHWFFVSIGSILLIAGSIMLIVSAIFFVDTLLFLFKAESVQGTIVELVPIPNDSLEPYYLKVAFREETTKRRFEFISSGHFSSKAYNEDEKINVFYDPKNPEDAKAGDSGELFEWKLIILFPGLFFFWVGFFFIRTGRKIIRPKKL
jgi:hypothetical protein